MLLSTVEKTLNDDKARDVLTLDVSAKTSIIDYMIICTASSSRHAKAVAGSLIKAAKQAGVAPLSVEGLDLGNWVLVHLGFCVVHIMLADMRSLYALDELWGETSSTQHKLNPATPSSLEK